MWSLHGAIDYGFSFTNFFDMATFFFCLIQSFQRVYNRKLEYKRQMSCRAKIFTAGKAVLGNNIPGGRGNWKRVSQVKNGGLINLLLIHK